jgi:hypothetical protein
VVVVWAKPQVEPWRWWLTKKVAEGLAVDGINLGSGFCWKTLWFSEIDVECFLPLDVIFDTCS